MVWISYSCNLRFVSDIYFISNFLISLFIQVFINIYSMAWHIFILKKSALYRHFCMRYFILIKLFNLDSILLTKIDRFYWQLSNLNNYFRNEIELKILFWRLSINITFYCCNQIAILDWRCVRKVKQ